MKLDFSALQSPVLGCFAEKDGFVPPEAAQKLERDLKNAGKNVDFTVFSDADHAFFNDTRSDVYHDEYARQCWERMVKFFGDNLS